MNKEFIDKKELFCSPRKKSDNITCYTLENLRFLIKAYNKNKPEKYQINVGNKSKKELWLDLNKKLKKDCTNEWCWLEQKFVPAPYARKLEKENFKPETPEEWNKNPFEWLSTSDIKDVMKQYERKYPSFLFMGPVPVDCPGEITCSLSGLDVGLLVERLGKTKLGVIYNLDRHDEPGSHWVATYFDFKKGNIIYFDSVGLPPPKLILDFLHKMKKSCEKYYRDTLGINKDVDIYINETRFQFGNSECGIFSMYFIISNLKGVGITELSNETTNDEAMNELRKKYYRPNVP